MNVARIISSANTITETERSLAWLREYGTQLTGRTDGASVTVHLSFAGSCVGSTDAAKTLSAYATLEIPNLVQTAITSCENTIAMCRDAIREEIEAAS